MPKVSIIVPNYNHEKYLPQRLASIFEQTFQDFEVILLDDCSTDNSLAILNQYSKHPKVSNFVINKKNGGSTFKQWEKGIQLARGDYIWIAESDDSADDTFLETVLTVLLQNSSVSLAYTQSNITNENSEVTDNWSRQTRCFIDNPWTDSFISNGRKIISTYLIDINIIPNASAVVFRKKAYLECNGINAKMRINGDWLLWIHLLQNYDIAFINKDLNSCRFHSKKGSTKNVRNFNNIKEFYIIINFVFSIIDFTSGRKEQVLQNIFTLWKNQHRYLDIVYFPKVALAAIQVDKQFIRRNIIFYFNKFRRVWGWK